MANRRKKRRGTRSIVGEANKIGVSMIGKWKKKSTMNEGTIEEKARTVLRSYLIRCYKTISADHPEIANMPPENAADYLIHLRNSGRITITLDTVGNRVVCQIENSDRQQ